VPGLDQCQWDHFHISLTVPSPRRQFLVALHRITQNHRMVGVGRDLCGSSSPTPLSKEGHLQRAAQDLVQAGLEYLQRRRLHDLPGQPVPVLHHPQTEEVLPRVQMELGPVCSSFSSHKERFCSIPLCNELACPFDYKKTFGKAGRGLSAPM